MLFNVRSYTPNLVFFPLNNKFEIMGWFSQSRHKNDRYLLVCFGPLVQCTMEAKRYVVHEGICEIRTSEPRTFVPETTLYYTNKGESVRFVAAVNVWSYFPTSYIGL